MNTQPKPRAKSAYPNGHKHPIPVTPLFSLFHNRRTIALNVSGTLALRFKRRYPASIVKFTSFTCAGGAA